MVGFFIAATAILTLDHLDETVKTSAQAEEILPLPVLGFITDPPDVRDGLVTLQRSSSKGAEAFRSLGFRMEFAVPEKSVHTLLILGADPEAAKTTIAANLGIVFAQQGKRVILLDGDLNAPHLHSLLGMDAEPGVADLLLEQDVDIRSVSHPVAGIEGMMLIPGGTVTENLIGWRNGDRWQDILIQLQKQADLVIIDGPSVEIASAPLLASKVDAVLLSIQLGKTRVDSAMTALRQLQFVGARIAGAVLYRAPKYRTIELRNFRWFRANQKGGNKESRNKVSEKTIALS
jgi:Mrp family chromosome partitioning ATPase